MSEVETLYMNSLLEQRVIKEEGIHPFLYSFERNTTIPKEGEEFAHPVNFFLQQQAMTSIWQEKGAMSLGGGGQVATADQGAEEEVEEAPSSFDLVLIKVDPKFKVKSIKEAKNVLGLDLKQVILISYYFRQRI